MSRGFECVICPCSPLSSARTLSTARRLFLRFGVWQPTLSFFSLTHSLSHNLSLFLPIYFSTSLGMHLNVNHFICTVSIAIPRHTECLSIFFGFAFFVRFFSPHVFIDEVAYSFIQTIVVDERSNFFPSYCILHNDFMVNIRQWRINTALANCVATSFARYWHCFNAGAL